ncbi:hypothetical protein BDF14DRAFT_1852363 [Spinellus fusiger]|nr:hypothetical protein BDF14DRAFT_1852363 [Spinellus fusiger]
MSTALQQKPVPNTTEIRVLVLSSLSAFGAGIAGAVWHTKRKQKKEALLEATLAQNERSRATWQADAARKRAVPLQHIYTPATPAYTPPKMTPAEYTMAKKEANFFAFKILAYGTMLAWGSAGVLALGVGYWLEVRSFKEFSDKLQVIVPRQTSRLRKALGGSAFVMKEEEQQEIDAIVIED